MIRVRLTEIDAEGQTISVVDNVEDIVYNSESKWKPSSYYTEESLVNGTRLVLKDNKILIYIGDHSDGLTMEGKVHKTNDPVIITEDCIIDYKNLGKCFKLEFLGSEGEKSENKMKIKETKPISEKPEPEEVKEDVQQDEKKIKMVITDDDSARQITASWRSRDLQSDNLAAETTELIYKSPSKNNATRNLETDEQKQIDAFLDESSSSNFSQLSGGEVSSINIQEVEDMNVEIDENKAQPPNENHLTIFSGTNTRMTDEEVKSEEWATAEETRNETTTTIVATETEIEMEGSCSHGSEINSVDIEPEVTLITTSSQHSQRNGRLINIHSGLDDDTTATEMSTPAQPCSINGSEPPSILRENIIQLDEEIPMMVDDLENMLDGTSNDADDEVSTMNIGFERMDNPVENTNDQIEDSVVDSGIQESSAQNEKSPVEKVDLNVSMDTSDLENFLDESSHDAEESKPDENSHEKSKLDESSQDGEKSKPEISQEYSKEAAKEDYQNSEKNQEPEASGQKIEIKEVAINESSEEKQRTQNDQEIQSEKKKLKRSSEIEQIVLSESINCWVESCVKIQADLQKTPETDLQTSENKEPPATSENKPHIPKPQDNNPISEAIKDGTNEDNIVTDNQSEDNISKTSIPILVEKTSANKKKMNKRQSLVCDIEAIKSRIRRSLGGLNALEPNLEELDDSPKCAGAVEMPEETAENVPDSKISKETVSEKVCDALSTVIGRKSFLENVVNESLPIDTIKNKKTLEDLESENSELSDKSENHEAESENGSLNKEDSADIEGISGNLK
eukprot:UN22509